MKIAEANINLCHRSLRIIIKTTAGVGEVYPQVAALVKKWVQSKGELVFKACKHF